MNVAVITSSRETANTANVSLQTRTTPLDLSPLEFCDGCVNAVRVLCYCLSEGPLSGEKWWMFSNLQQCEWTDSVQLYTGIQTGD